MSISAQYASIPRNGQTTISTANVNRDGTGTLGVVATAPATANDGTRFDRIVVAAGGTTTTNVIRFYITQGLPGVAITSITAVGTTATVTTSSAHGLTSGNLVTLQYAFPNDYNVTAVVITVTSTTAFTYTMATTPTLLTASTVGNYSTTPAVPVTRLWRELLVTAITPSTSVGVFTVQMSSASAADIGFMPLVLQAGYSLRASTNNAETYYITASNSGDLI